MSALAIIPARGGSKRIPRKNIRPFLGKPVIAYSIETAFESQLFDEVMVSTDDEEISTIAQGYGAAVPFFRSAERADDFATLNDVFLEVVNGYAARQEKFDVYCLLLPTAPLITVEHLIGGYRFLMSTQFDSVRPVARFDYPVQRAVRLHEGHVTYVNPEFENTRSQDLEPLYHDSGTFYFIRKDCEISGGNRGGFEIEHIYVQDIDTEQDWKIAEFKYAFLKGADNCV